MMMGYYGFGMHVFLLLAVSIAAGFAYVVWILATKESGVIKVVGQIIAAILAVLIILSLVVGGYKCATYKGMYGSTDSKHGKMMKMKEMMHMMSCPMMHVTPEAKKTK